MLETVSTRISLGIEKRGHPQKKCSVFSEPKLQTQIGGCIKKIVIFSVTFQLGKTHSQLKQFFDTGRVVNSKYGFFSWTNGTQ